MNKSSSYPVLFILLLLAGCAASSTKNDFSPGVAALFPVGVGEEWRFINRNGEVVIQIKNEGAIDFIEGRALIKKDGKWGYINEWDIVVITPVYEEAHSFSEGLAQVKVEGRYGYINSVGEMAIDPIYEKSNPFSEGLASVRHNGLWGYINK